MPMHRTFGILIVLPQQVASEVPIEVAPHRMDMIAAILGRVVLDEELRALDAVVVLPSALRRSGPPEANALDAAFVHAHHARFGERRLECVRVDLDELD